MITSMWRRYPEFLEMHRKRLALFGVISPPAQWCGWRQHVHRSQGTEGMARIEASISWDESRRRTMDSLRCIVREQISCLYQSRSTNGSIPNHALAASFGL